MNLVMAQSTNHVITSVYNIRYSSKANNTKTSVSVASLVQLDVGLDQRSYSTLGPVSAWVGDRL